MIQPSLLFCLSAYVRVEQIEITPSVVMLSLAVATSEATCPLCQQASQRVHSRYTRTLQDLPCVGKALQLLVVVRRFFCTNQGCARKIFAERLPELTSIYARRTSRCHETLTELGFALGGKAAAERLAQLALPSSRITILRMLRHTSEAAMPTPLMLGVDEFALLCGKTYGTILVNLETGMPVDLLPDRQAATLERWLTQHPGVLLISRGRAGEFACGAAAGAPEALQTADRFHVLRNLAEVVEKVLDKHRQALKTVHLVTTPATSPSPFLRHQRPDREQRKQQVQAKLVERYEAAHRLLKQGLSHCAIAQHLHMHRESVIRYARADRFPEKPQRPVSPGIFSSL